MNKVKSASDHLDWIMNIHVIWTQSTQQKQKVWLAKSANVFVLWFLIIKFDANIHVKCLTVMKLAYLSCLTNNYFIYKYYVQVQTNVYLHYNFWLLNQG